jgi:glycerophosphoryl diester phosphodiesterase
MRLPVTASATAPRRFDLQGHRGARGLFPENTLDGFARSIALGVDTLELDVGMTADGVVVVTHDPALNPDITRDPAGDWLTEGGILIRSLTLDALRRFDVGRIRPGTRYAARFAEQRPADGARIPTLAEVLRLDPHIRFNIEMKSFPDHPDWTVSPVALAEAVAEVLAAEGASSRATVQSFDWRGPRHLRRIGAGLALSWLTEAETVAAAALWWDGPSLADFGGSIPHAVAAEGAGADARDSWAPDHAALTAAEVATAHALGLRIVPWTVNEPDDMRRLIGFGVDGLITDRPDLALRCIASAG